ncbi:MAG: glutamate racemase, partial [Acidimicrobiales bacterium]|nr:glutamate racemase [Acidimicrobiales bacterium]
DIPILGVIEPGVRAALAVSNNQKVGVIGTVGTIGSGAYQHEFTTIANDVKLTCAACPGFVEFVERGDLTSDQVHVLGERLLSPIVSSGADTLLLGCTHYPFLARTISDVVGREVVLVSSADETAFDVAKTLEKLGLATNSVALGTQRFLCSGDPETFKTIGERLYGSKLGYVEQWPL